VERGADLHMAQLMPLPLTVSCFRKIQIGSTLLVPARLGSPGKRAVKWMCALLLNTLLVPVTDRLATRSSNTTVMIGLWVGYILQVHAVCRTS